jgi:hypothetical protein
MPESPLRSPFCALADDWFAGVRNRYQRVLSEKIAMQEILPVPSRWLPDQTDMVSFHFAMSILGGTLASRTGHFRADSNGGIVLWVHNETHSGVRCWLAKELLSLACNCATIISSQIRESG